MDEELAGESRSLEDRSEGQYALFTLDQALAAGMNQTTVYRRARLGRYVLEHPRVFSFAGLPAFWERSILAACLAARPRLRCVTIHRSMDLQLEQTTVRRVSGDTSAADDGRPCSGLAARHGRGRA